MSASLNRIDILPKHLQNLICEFNCDHRTLFAPSLVYIQEHRKCAYCECVIRGINTIFPGVRFFCDNMCRDQLDYERSVDDYVNQCLELNPDLYKWF